MKSYYARDTSALLYLVRRVAENRLDQNNRRQQSFARPERNPDKASQGNRPLLMRRVLTYRSGVTLVGAESSPAPRHSGLHKLETSIDNRTLVPILQR